MITKEQVLCIIKHNRCKTLYHSKTYDDIISIAEMVDDIIIKQIASLPDGPDYNWSKLIDKYCVKTWAIIFNRIKVKHHSPVTTSYITSWLNIKSLIEAEEQNNK
jgi:hypothetical protein